jgi:hypothetical protein
MAKSMTPRVAAATILLAQLDFKMAYADQVSLTFVREVIGVKVTQATADKVAEQVEKLSAKFRERLDKLILNHKEKKTVPEAFKQHVQAKKKKPA